MANQVISDDGLCGSGFNGLCDCVVDNDSKGTSIGALRSNSKCYGNTVNN